MNNYSEEVVGDVLKSILSNTLKLELPHDLVSYRQYIDVDIADIKAAYLFQYYIVRILQKSKSNFKNNGVSNIGLVWSSVDDFKIIFQMKYHDVTLNHDIDYTNKVVGDKVNISYYTESESKDDDIKDSFQYNALPIMSVVVDAQYIKILGELNLFLNNPINKDVVKIILNGWDSDDNCHIKHDKLTVAVAFEAFDGVTCVENRFNGDSGMESRFSYKNANSTNDKFESIIESLLIGLDYSGTKLSRAAIKL